MKRITCIWSILVIFPQLFHVYVMSKECVTQQAKVMFAFDGTTNLNSDQRDLMFQFVQGVVSSLPDGSECTCVYINQDSKEMSRFTVSGSRPSFAEEAERIQWNPAGQSITANALAKEVNVSFPVAFLNRKAEMFYLLVSDKTVIESFPEVLLKKKIFITVFGSIIPDGLKNLASSADHVNLIRNLKDLQSVVETVTKLTCIDSFLKCDVDEYMGKRASKCTSCMSVCSYKTSEQPRACHLHCPYILIPPREYAVKVAKDPMKEESMPPGVDNKYTTLGVVISALFVFVTLFNVGVGKVCRRRNLLCFHRNAEPINGHETEMDTIQPFIIPDTEAVPETGGNENSGQIQGQADGANLSPATEHDPDQVRQPEPSDFLKNRNEKDMNHLALCDPQMIDVQTGKHFGTR